MCHCRSTWRSSVLATHTVASAVCTWLVDTALLLTVDANAVQMHRDLLQWDQALKLAQRWVALPMCSEFWHAICNIFVVYYLQNLVVSCLSLVILPFCTVDRSLACVRAVTHPGWRRQRSRPSRASMASSWSSRACGEALAGADGAGATTRQRWRCSRPVSILNAVCTLFSCLFLGVAHWECHHGECSLGRTALTPRRAAQA
jgi:hypothetical protein